ncbi:hypothetical protein EDD21DRAFT_374628 [Dissophora ornata]|nr:hypothetical protein EDD21DRAFT_374628 [Dissophora ornata]
MYPNMESKVNAQLAKTGTFFQSYIRRGLANLAAEANTAAAGGTLPISSSGVGVSGIGSQIVRDRETADAIARRRESTMSIASSEGGAGATGSTSTDPSESYKDRLARLQQMFGYKSDSKTPSPVQDGHAMEGRNSPILTSRQQQELDYQQHQLQQQQILAQHSRSRPSSLYQSSLASGTASPTTSQFGGSISGLHSPYQTHFNHQDSLGSNKNMNNGFGNPGGAASGSFSGISPSSPAPTLQALQESMAAKERAQTVALMKERLAKMKTQTLTSSQLALQQFHQQQAAGADHENGGAGHVSGNGGAQYF